MEADIVVLDMKPDEFIEWRMREVESVFDRLFILQTLAPDRLVHATYVAGKKVYDREIQKFQKDIRNISF